MTLTLYIDMMSQPSRAVLLFCKENGIPHKVELVQIAKGENRSAKYKAINPLGKVPAIDDAGFKLTESHAILQYLATTRSVADHWYPKDPKARARVDEMLHWHHANLRAGSAGTVFPKALAPRLGLPVNQPLLEQAEKTLTLALKFLESVLKKQPFVAGSSVSIADLSLACELDMLRLIPYDLSAYPSIIVWMDRIKALANWKSVTAVLDKAAAAMAKSAASSKSALSAAPTAASGASYGRIDDSANSAKKVMRSAAVFDAIREKLSVDGADMVRDLGSVFRFELSSKDKGKPVTYSWVIDAKSGSGAVNEGDTETKADTTFVMSDDDFINLAGGKGNPKMMFMTGKLKIKGSAGRALKFSEVVLKKRAKEIKDVIAKLPPKAKL